MLAVLKDDFGKQKIKAALQRVGRHLAAANLPADNLPLKARLERALQGLENLGGQARVTREHGKTLIRAAGCPLAAVTVNHVEVCEMLEAFLSQIIGAPVRQACNRVTAPQCCFEVRSAPRGKEVAH